MFLSHIKVNNFRNLENASVSFSCDLNVISGNNAAGKSSLLEAITYLLSGRSFRTTKQDLLISHGKENFNLYGVFSNNKRLGVSYQKSLKLRRIKLDGENIRSLSSVASLYPVQVLSPESYHLIDSGPLERRKYLDWLLFHVKHCYQDRWNKYNRVLKQRNAFLKTNQSINVNKINQVEFDGWNDQYIDCALDIDRSRKDLVNLLIPVVKKILKSIEFEHALDITFALYSGWTGDLKNRLKESLSRDLLLGTTHYGPHKSDLKLKVASNLAKDVLSRGQKKLLVNCLYLAQTEILKDETEKDSLFIVDDFSSELDESNQEYLVEALRKQKNVQIILSCLQADMLKGLIKGYNNVKMFHVEHGEIKEV